MVGSGETAPLRIEAPRDEEQVKSLPINDPGVLHLGMSETTSCMVMPGHIKSHVGTDCAKGKSP